MSLPAEEFALTCSDAEVLATRCTPVVRLPEPTAIERRYASYDGEPPLDFLAAHEVLEAVERLTTRGSPERAGEGSVYIAPPRSD
ncbi:hypothetical protein [Streptomyces sp. NPDC093544]|uniref:hypothetical protein n=1 Tax=Streptomyces sp. NPDC093544 TaxID=3155200 RepID=UPI00341BEEB1